MHKLTDKLKLKEFKLSSLLEITKAINDNNSVSQLLKIYEFILREQLGITRLILYYKGDEWNCIQKYGYKGKVKDINADTDLIHIKEITVIESSSKDSLNWFDVVIPVFHKEKPLAYLLIGDLNEDAIRISPTIKHMPFIQTLTNIIVVAIENKRMAKESIKQERTKKELEVASEMQSLLFPKSLPSNNRVDIAAKYKSQHMVGGDYYDYIPINNEEFVFCMADVSGKGVSAALLMSNFQANLRAIINYCDFHLPQIIRELNEKVMNSAQGEKFITFFLGKYNITHGRLSYINAGHNPPILTNGQNERLLEVGCTGLGMFDEIPKIDYEELSIEPNSTLMTYTDGLVEIENEEGEAFDIPKVVKFVHDNYDKKMSELNDALFKQIEEFKGNAPFIDDTALLSIRFF